jgi:hypothetical protein
VMGVRGRGQKTLYTATPTLALCEEEGTRM